MEKIGKTAEELWGKPRGIVRWRGEEFPSNFYFKDGTEDRELSEGEVIGMALAYLATDFDCLLVYSQGMVISISKMKYDEHFQN